MSQNFISQLQKGPAFLFLGQNTLKIPTGEDDFLNEILRKYGDSRSQAGKAYNKIFLTKVNENIESSLAWMQQRSERLPVPVWLQNVAEFPWNGVYTTSIDSIWRRAFNLPWRQLQPIYTKDYQPADPRNRSKLHITYLFGDVTRDLEDERCPLTPSELANRRSVATVMSSKLQEWVTPLGVLAIEGYSLNDWLDSERLYGIVSGFNKGQVHLFSATNDLMNDIFIELLVSNGTLILHEKSLFETINEAERRGEIHFSFDPEEDGFERRITINNHSVAVPVDIWNQLSKTATVLDDKIMIEPQAISKEKYYQEFRHFLADSGFRPVWQAYARRFAFKRDYEIELFDRVVEVLKDRKNNEPDPIILRGPTGTGKSVALGSLAYEIRKMKRYPVLYIERKPSRISQEDIAEFCKWAEDKEAPASLIVWDGMVEPEQYFKICNYLANLGRKVVVVGSCPKLLKDESDATRDEKMWIDAPGALKEDESKRFEEYIQKFGMRLQKSQIRESTFLVHLYRYFIDTHRMLRLGVQHETLSMLEDAGDLIRREQPVKELSPFAEQLANKLKLANIFSQEQSSEWLQYIEMDGEMISHLEDLIRLIMVPSQFGIKVPFDLILRTGGKDGYINFAKMLDRYDMFIHAPDGVGNEFVGARTSLEAKMLIDSFIGSPAVEVEYATRLLENVRNSTGFIDGDDIQFAAEFLRNLGINVSNSKYIKWFPDLWKSLFHLRDKMGVIHPRLLLLEANLIREYIVHDGIDDFNEAENLLNEAESILRKAMSLLSEERMNRALQSSIMVELAAVAGCRVKRRISTKNTDSREIMNLFTSFNKQIMEARHVDAESFYPVDILTWTTKAILDNDILDPVLRAETIASILHVYEMVNSENISTSQQQRFLQRKLDLHDNYGNSKIAEETFQQLVDRGSKAGFYLRALQMIDQNNIDEARLTRRQIEQYAMAYEYLENNRANIRSDGRCMFLLFKTWFIKKTGTPLFYKERQVLSFTPADWGFMKKLLTEIMLTEEYERSHVVQYFRGVASFHLEDYIGAGTIFKELEGMTENMPGSRRIISSYMSGSIKGKPIKYQGEIRSIADNSRRGFIYVPALRINIPFIYDHFGRRNLRRGDSLEFYISFNFRGALVDPMHYYDSLQEKKS